jgi:glycine/D-amino acid oxidase-like deaminating enzyme
VFGASVDPSASYSTRGSLEFAEGVAGHVLQLMPALSKMPLLRQWAGLCDMTPDFSPIMGPTRSAASTSRVGKDEHVRRRVHVAGLYAAMRERDLPDSGGWRRSRGR